MTPQDALAAELKGLEELLLVPGAQVESANGTARRRVRRVRQFGSCLYQGRPCNLASGGIARHSNNVGLQSHLIGAGCRAPDLQDPSSFSAGRAYASFVGLAKSKWQMADDFPSGDDYPDVLEMPEAATNGHRGHAPNSPISRHNPVLKSEGLDVSSDRRCACLKID